MNLLKVTRALFERKRQLHIDLQKATKLVKPRQRTLAKPITFDFTNPKKRQDNVFAFMRRYKKAPGCLGREDHIKIQYSTPADKRAKKCENYNYQFKITDCHVRRVADYSGNNWEVVMSSKESNFVFLVGKSVNSALPLTDKPQILKSATALTTDDLDINVIFGDSPKEVGFPGSKEFTNAVDSFDFRPDPLHRVQSLDQKIETLRKAFSNDQCIDTKLSFIHMNEDGTGIFEEEMLPLRDFEATEMWYRDVNDNYTPVYEISFKTAKGKTLKFGIPEYTHTNLKEYNLDILYMVDLFRKRNPLIRAAKVQHVNGFHHTNGVGSLIVKPDDSAVSSFTLDDTTGPFTEDEQLFGTMQVPAHELRRVLEMLVGETVVVGYEVFDPHTKEVRVERTKPKTLYGVQVEASRPLAECFSGVVLHLGDKVNGQYENTEHLTLIQSFDPSAVRRKNFDGEEYQRRLFGIKVLES